MPSRSQHTDNPLLVGRRQAGEKRGLLGCLGQLGIGHRIHLTTQEHMFGHEAHLTADLPADKLVIAG